MGADGFSKRLEGLEEYRVVFTRHALVRLIQRQVPEAVVMDHLRRPSSLRLVEKLEARQNEEKYKLWFVPAL